MFSNRKKKVTAGIGVTAVAAAAIALTAGTYAGFSDSEDSAITGINTATLDLDDDSLLGTINNLLPGVTNALLGTLVYQNDGSVPANLSAVIGGTGSDGNICDVPLVGGLVNVVPDIGNVLCPLLGQINNLVSNLSISFNVVQNVASDVTDNLPAAGLLSTIFGGDNDIDLNLGVIQPGETVNIQILGTVLSSVGNLIQGDILNLGSVATLSQLP